MKKLNKMTQNKKVAASGYETATAENIYDRNLNSNKIINLMRKCLLQDFPCFF